MARTRRSTSAAGVLFVATSLWGILAAESRPATSAAGAASSASSASAAASSLPSASASTAPSALTPAAASAAALAFPAGVPSPLKVGVAILINEFGKINEAEGTFEVNLDLQLRWRDPRLAYDAQKVGADRQEFLGDAVASRLATMWKPAVAFSNMASDKPTSLEAALFIYSNGSVVYIQRLGAAFKSNFSMAAFPFDSQSLGLRLLTSRNSANQVLLVQSQQDIDASGFNATASASGWELKGLSFTPSTARGMNGDAFSTMTTQVGLSRDWVFHAVNIFVPLFSLLLVPTVLTLYTNVSVESRLAAWSGAILALVALCFTFSVNYPAASSGNTFLAQLNSIGFAFELLMLGLSLTILNPEMADKFPKPFVMDEISRVLRWVIPIGLIALILQRLFALAYA